MKTLFIEGFKVVTDLDECRNFKELCHIEGIDSNTDECLENIKIELYSAAIIDFIEKVGIGGMSVASYFYENCRGYKQKSLEPMNWRASKKKLTIIYTGSQGGGGWFADIYLIDNCCKSV